MFLRYLSLYCTATNQTHNIQLMIPDVQNLSSAEKMRVP